MVARRADPKSLPLATAYGLSLSQAEVDFVIPDLARDIPLCIDPFLLYKSRDPSLRDLHAQLLRVFERGFELHAAGDRRGLDRLIDFPEVSAIGFGYTRAGRRGTGLGWHLNQLLADLLESGDEIRRRGLRHVEELQLLSVGVGPDRVSDIAANILKSSLVAYTQEQSELWRIPLRRSVPLSHILDLQELEWRDDYVDLPVSPSGQALLLVPRRIVRLLPWINYGDFHANEAQLFLPPRARLPRYPGMPKTKRLELAKAELVTRVQANTSVLDQYIARKEREAAAAEPLLPEDVIGPELRRTAEDLLARFATTPAGQNAAGDYQRLVYETLNFLFEPELTGGEIEVRTYLGTERRDIVYWNEAERSFWAYVRDTYLSPLLMFECKNVEKLEIDHVNQLATYLGARIGMLGALVTRNPPPEPIVRKAYSVYNDSPAVPRKVILVLSDADLRRMIEMRVAGERPVSHVQGVYRAFRSRVQ